MNGLSISQDMLWSPSPGDWLAPGHLAYFVVDVVAALDVTSFTSGRRDDGKGGASYDPRAMLGVLLYGYMTGVLSSRTIERKTGEDMGFMVTGLGCRPDHTSLCRFRAGHDQGFRQVFTQVLRLCADAGLVDMSMIAVDGTKMKADAALAKSYTAEHLASLLTQEAATVDATEDAAVSTPLVVSGLGLTPAGSHRQQRIKQALTDLENEHAQAVRAHDEKRVAREQRIAAGGPPGRRLKDTLPVNDQTRPIANITDPHSRAMRTRTGYEQAYNAHVAVVASQVIVAADVFDARTDVNLFIPVVTQAIDQYIDATGQTPPVTIDCLADAGYYSMDNAALDTVTAWIPDTRRYHHDDHLDQKLAQRHHRHQVLTQYETKQITARHAAELLHVTTGYIYTLALRHRQEPSPLDRLDTRMATPEGKTKYKQRSTMVEPVFAQIKHNRGIRRFTRRGLPAVKTEFHIITTTSNLLKIFHNQ